MMFGIDESTDDDHVLLDCCIKREGCHCHRLVSDSPKDIPLRIRRKGLYARRLSAVKRAMLPYREGRRGEVLPHVARRQT